MVFLYGFVSLARALWNFFLFNTINIGSYIKSGQLDLILIRPVNPLFQLISEKMDFESIGELIYSIVLLVVTINFMDLDRKSTRLNSSHVAISYAVFCLK